jgi:hypothetical protein
MSTEVKILLTEEVLSRIMEHSSCVHYYQQRRNAVLEKNNHVYVSEHKDGGYMIHLPENGLLSNHGFQIDSSGPGLVFSDLTSIFPEYKREFVLKLI